jgi:hypothetical protein
MTQTHRRRKETTKRKMGQTDRTTWAGALEGDHDALTVLQRLTRPGNAAKRRKATSVQLLCEATGRLAEVLEEYLDAARQWGAYHLLVLSTPSRELAIQLLYEDGKCQATLMYKRARQAIRRQREVLRRSHVQWAEAVVLRVRRLEAGMSGHVVYSHEHGWAIHLSTLQFMLTEVLKRSEALFKTYCDQAEARAIEEARAQAQAHAEAEAQAQAQAQVLAQELMLAEAHAEAQDRALAQAQAQDEALAHIQFQAQAERHRLSYPTNPSDEALGAWQRRQVGGCKRPMNAEERAIGEPRLKRKRSNTEVVVLTGGMHMDEEEQVVVLTGWNEDGEEEETE